MLHEKEIALAQHAVRTLTAVADKWERKYRSMLRLGCTEESLRWPLREKAACQYAIGLVERELRQLAYEQRRAVTGSDGQPPSKE